MRVLLVFLTVLALRGKNFEHILGAIEHVRLANYAHVLCFDLGLR